MDVLKQQLARIQQQLGGLSISQRMLSASLLAILVMTVLYWGRYAAAPEMVPVLDQPFTAEQSTRFVSALERIGITAKVATDGRVMVPADRISESLAAMTYNRLLPSNSSASVDKIVSQMTLWDSNDRTNKLYNEKKEALLAQIIAGWPGVASAVVSIDPAERRSFTSPSQPTASVNITMQEGQRAPDHIVLAAADTVAGSQAGLSRGAIRVVIDGVSRQLPDPDADGGLSGGMLFEQKQKWEKHYLGKVRDALPHMRNPIIGVNVEIDNKRVDETSDEVDPAKIVYKEKEVMSQETETTTPPPISNEPGAIPNVGTGLAQPPAAGGVSTSKTDKTSFELLASRTQRTTRTGAGTARVTSASVRLPRSHFVNTWKQLNPKANADPDDAALAPMITQEVDSVRKTVMACTGLTIATSVTVDLYTDAPVDPVEAGSVPKGVPVMNFVSGYGKEVALGGLALAALFMVSGIVKKGAGGLPAATAAAVAEQQREMERFASGEEVVGSATEGVSSLEAMELDEETSATQQMVNQVSNMVKENPDAAVSLVKRWMNRT